MADAAAPAPPALAAPVAETSPGGLTGALVAERRSRGLTNAGGEHTSRSVAEILCANILTRFNFILGVLLAVILVAGQPQDALFGVVVVTNALIGIAQELCWSAPCWPASCRCSRYPRCAASTRCSCRAAGSAPPWSSPH
jgi:hypothetical protein